MKQRKKEWVVEHAKQRAQERYGLCLNKEMRTNIVNAIQSGRAKHLCSYTLRKTAFVVDVKGTECTVVYDKKLHEVLTFLPAGVEW